MTSYTVKTTGQNAAVLYEGTNYDAAVALILAREDAVMTAREWKVSPGKTWCDVGGFMI